VGLTTGYTYYFAVTAIDRAGMESAYSNEVSKTMP
jgi:fibronectin type 3 domain-containing protein